MKNKSGITLVSLVVTIIVLIILAGVSINLTLGENGIITMAKRARENMELAKVDEERQLNELYMQMEQEGLSGGISYDAMAKLTEFKREIASAITDMGINTAENADVSTMSTNIRNISTNKDASSITYDNSNSSLKSTHIQGAIDELDRIQTNLNNNYVGWVAKDTFEPSDMVNVTKGTIKVVNRNGIVSLYISNLECTPNTPILGLYGFIGKYRYIYDTSGTGLYIDNSQLYSSKSSIEHLVFTFALEDHVA